LGDVSHPNAHGGIYGKESHAREGLALLEDGKRGFAELEDLRSDKTFGAGSEDELAIGAGHVGKDSRKAVMAMADL
jgi:hypothetical protein